MRPARPPARLPIFRSAEQARLLQRIYLWPTQEWTFQELADGGPSPATVDRELAILRNAGMVAVERVGRTRIFRPKTDSPLYKPLHQLLERTLGVEVLLRRALGNVAGVDGAAIFGSWAAGRATDESDLDLLVLGDVDYNRLVEAIHPVGQAIGREVNLVSYSPDELRKKLSRDDGFLRRLLKGATVNVIGDVQELAGARG
jgi:predicted nucleotidyltransferase